ncbi:MAG: hypothetical protein ABSA83_01375 [Verrucomicrobiota bacterium]
MLPFEVISLILFFLALPIFLQWHHVLLIVFWNSVFNAAFLPGQPDFWLFFAFVSFAISFLNHVLFQKSFLHAPEMTRPLLFLAVVVLGTAELRGGIGIRSMGGTSYGGRYYVFVLGAILGYFAFTSESIPILKGRKMANWFFIAGVTNALGNIAFMLGPLFYIFYLILPTTQAVGQAQAEAAGSDVVRVGGFATASLAVLSFLFVNYGIRGLFDWSKPWRFIFLCLTVVAACLSGFRSTMAMLFLVFIIQFYYEGLFHTRLLPIVVGLAILSFIPILFFSSSMPGSVQRAISFLPVNVNPEILVEAKSSADWRVEMWDTVSREIPKYLLLGKGYTINPDEIFAVNEAARIGFPVSAYETCMVAGDYHSGPLSVLIPFGAIGAIAFIWVLIGGFQVLYRNHRYGDAKLRRINCVLLSCYLARCFSFFFIFGALSTEFSVFLGLCGLSVSLNGGVKRRVVAPKRVPVPVAQQTLAMDPG